MGLVESMGCCVNPGDNQALKAEASTEGKPKESGWIDNGVIKAPKNCVFSRPLFNEARNEVIFLFARENQHNLFVKTLNLDKMAYSKKIKLEYASNLELNECVYTLHEATQCIYLIHDNKDLLRIDLQSKNVSSIASIRSCFDTPCSRVQIHSVGDKVLVLGAEHDAEQKSQDDDPLVYVAYDANKKIGGGKAEQKGFGAHSTTLSVEIKGEPYVVIMGGDSEELSIAAEASELVQTPTNTMWFLNVSALDKNGDAGKTFQTGNKWVQRFIFARMHSFGVVVSDNSKLMVVLGGSQYTLKTGEQAVHETIHAMDLESAATSTELGSVSGYWKEMTLKMPTREGYFAVYQKDKKRIHAFSFSGRHFVLSMKTIERDFESCKDKTTTNIKDWMDAGKTMVPTKTSSIRNIGPKVLEGDVSSDDEEEEEDK